MTLGSGLELLKGVFCHRLDPSSSPDGTASKVIVDATGSEKKISATEMESCDHLKHRGVDQLAYPLGNGHLKVLKMTSGADAKAVLKKVVNGPGLTLCVDDDIDPSDLRQIVWSIATRFQPAEDMILNNGGMGVDGTKPPGWKARRATLPFK
jgi:3-polyprenyl-4-hydroxybenzoate decarboxylase